MERDRVSQHPLPGCTALHAGVLTGHQLQPEEPGGGADPDRTPQERTGSTGDDRDRKTSCGRQSADVRRVARHDLVTAIREENDGGIDDVSGPSASQQLSSRASDHLVHGRDVHSAQQSTGRRLSAAIAPDSVPGPLALLRRSSPCRCATLRRASMARSPRSTAMKAPASSTSALTGQARRTGIPAPSLPGRSHPESAHHARSPSGPGSRRERSARSRAAAASASQADKPWLARLADARTSSPSAASSEMLDLVDLHRCILPRYAHTMVCRYRPTILEQW